MISTSYLMLGTEYLMLGTPYSMLSTSYSMLGTSYSMMLDTSYLILHTQCLVLHTQYLMLDTSYWMFGTSYSMLYAARLSFISSFAHNLTYFVLSTLLTRWQFMLCSGKFLISGMIVSATACNFGTFGVRWQIFMLPDCLLFHLLHTISPILFFFLLCWQDDRWSTVCIFFTFIG